MRIPTIVLLAAFTVLAAGCSPPARQAVPATVPAAVPADVSDAPVRLPTPTPAAAVQTEPAQPPSLLPELHNWGPAPELGNTEWLNSPPLRLADLRGQVVLVEFWTLGCINCQHVIPTLRRWHQQYSPQGLVVVGVHTPEFAYEKDAANVAAAVQRMEITWPVAIDNDWQTWRAYNNRFWPAMYLVDKEGNMRYLAIGEGNYERTEAVIAALLAEPATAETAVVQESGAVTLADTASPAATTPHDNTADDMAGEMTAEMTAETIAGEMTGEPAASGALLVAIGVLGFTMEIWPNL